MRSKVRISLGANNSLGPARWQSLSITLFVWRGRSKVYLVGVGTQSSLILEGFLVIKNKKKYLFALANILIPLATRLILLVSQKLLLWSSE
jgi:hypothetical protein